MPLVAVGEEEVVVVVVVDVELVYSELTEPDDVEVGQLLGNCVLQASADTTTSSQR